MSSDPIADALGASRVEDVDANAQGPLGLMQLRAQMRRRLRSTGGRPSDPSWTMRRVVPFNPDRWSALEALSERLSSEGRTVSPGQLAAMLIEHGLEELHDAVQAGKDPQDVLSTAPKQAS